MRFAIALAVTITFLCPGTSSAQTGTVQGTVSGAPRVRRDAVIYLAGADPFEGDRLGYLKLSKPGLRERDQRVLDTCRRLGLPLSISMAGGYANDVEDIVDIHYATVLAALAQSRCLAGEVEPRAATATLPAC